MSARWFSTGDVVRIRDERWVVLRCEPHEAAAVLEVEGIDTANRAARTAFLLPFEPCQPLPAFGRPQVVTPAKWRTAARYALAGATPAYASLRTAARARMSLLPFQLEPALAYTQGKAVRFLIADAVGLGKTIQAGLMIAEMLERTADGRALIVAPASLREQWRDEIGSRFRLQVEQIDAASVWRAVSLSPVGTNPWATARIVITSIDYVKRAEVIRALEPLIWDLMVFDEAHGLCGPSDRATAAVQLAIRARAIVLLTATPHTGDDRAYARLCNIGDVRNEFPLLIFRRTREALGSHQRRRTIRLKVRTSAAEAAMHTHLLRYAQLVWRETGVGSPAGARLAMSVLLRRACSSATVLARSVERRLKFLTADVSDIREQLTLPFAGGDDDDAPGMELASAGLRDLEREVSELQRLLGLARAASTRESKVMALSRYLARLSEPAIVFTQYRDTLQHLETALDPVSTECLHGGLSQHERREAARNFTHGSARLLLCTDAASEGLNLHRRCRIVLNLELPWTPLRLEQRVGRVDRLGQDRTVHAILLIAAGTYEESLSTRLDERIARVSHAMQSDTHDVDTSIAADLVEPTAPDVDRVAAPHLGAIAVGTVSQAAVDEAARLAKVRSFQATTGAVQSPRPVLTILPRRRGRGVRMWAFRLLFADGVDEVIWDTLIGLTDSGTLWPVRSSAYVRATLAVPQSVHELVARTHRERCDALAREIGTQLDLLAARDRAIAWALRQHHARLSAALVQRGLFDSRNERAANAQMQVLHAAQRQIEQRAHKIEGWRTPHSASSLLVFGVGL